MSRVTALLSLIVLLSVGCYHVTVLTGAKASNETIHETFAACWIYGLVPPSTIAAQEKCPNGVAKVETQQSFVNQLVGLLTLGIYTPMEIMVTCSEKTTAMMEGKGVDITLAPGASSSQIVQAFKDAADLAVREHRTVYVDY